MEPLFIPVILSTVRQGRMGEAVAHFILDQVKYQNNVTIELIDIRALPLPMMDAGPEAQIPEMADTVH